jgi:tRNA G18 (ribose-2'-O)-methylase SpoU
MGPVVDIRDVSDERVSAYRNLTDAQLRRREESPSGGAAGAFMVEGVLAIRQLLRSVYPVRSVLLSPSKLEVLGPELEAVEAPVYVAPADVLAAITGFHVHRGALAAAGRLVMPALDQMLEGARLIAILEGINDHENLGAMFRNAAAFGVDGVLLCPRCADPLYRRSVRVSLGHVLHVPWTRAGAWPAALEEVRAAGFQLAALTPGRRATPLHQLSAGDQRLGLLLGSEGSGLSDEALEMADCWVRIPLAEPVDSLNVATAAAIALYHLSSPTIEGSPCDAGG